MYLFRWFLTNLIADNNDDNGVYTFPTPGEFEIFTGYGSDSNIPVLGPESSLLEQLLELIDSLGFFHETNDNLGEFPIRFSLSLCLVC